MNVIEVDGVPDPELARRLSDFESQFTYPLGDAGRFRISHGDDYGRFYRAQGESRAFVAEKGGRIAGVMSVAIRTLGAHRVAYLGDLKIAAPERGGRVLLRLAQAASSWARPRVTDGFGVMMEGTRPTPEDYTGRAGIPEFRVVGRLSLFRLIGSGRAEVLSPEAGARLFAELSRGRTVVESGDSTLRSIRPARWLADPDGDAVGLLEDTRRAKRLFLEDGSELVSGHLGSFAWRTPEAAARLAKAASGNEALFMAVPDGEAAAFRRLLPDASESRAIVSGTMAPSPSWCLQTSEI